VHPQAQQDVEKVPSPSPHAYGTFLAFARSSKSNSDAEKNQTVQPREPTDNVWWALGVSLLVVGTIAIYAFVIVSAIL
jgi:uncharacterized membrane protein YidH (DUF202 family)